MWISRLWTFSYLLVLQVKTWAKKNEDWWCFQITFEHCNKLNDEHTVKQCKTYFEQHHVAHVFWKCISLIEVASSVISNYISLIFSLMRSGAQCRLRGALLWNEPELQKATDVTGLQTKHCRLQMRKGHDKGHDTTCFRRVVDFWKLPPGYRFFGKSIV